MRPTRVEFSCECTSFTTSEVVSCGISDSYVDRAGRGRAMQPAGNAATAAEESFRKPRRSRIRICPLLRDRVDGRDARSPEWELKRAEK
jgi:hypothetical protein